jgi:predicted AAA+ superfamily ATPase
LTATDSSHIDHFLDAFLISKARRFDIKRRKYIGSPFKFYFTDLGIRNAKYNFRQQEENSLRGAGSPVNQNIHDPANRSKNG